MTVRELLDQLDLQGESKEEVYLLRKEYGACWVKGHIYPATSVERILGKLVIV
jgi:hypothetical protein